MIQRACAQVDSKPDNVLLNKIYFLWFEHILLNKYQRDWAQILKLTSPSPFVS